MRCKSAEQHHSRPNAERKKQGTPSREATIPRSQMRHFTVTIQSSAVDAYIVEAENPHAAILAALILRNAKTRPDLHDGRIERTEAAPCTLPK
jgi:hypothetical protein